MAVDPSRMVVGPPSYDRYEDRIEAPGPFAPAPAPPAPPVDAGASEEARVEREAEAVHAEVRHVLGAAEDREALASLASGEDIEIEAVVDGLDAPREVQSVVPPLPEEPEEVTAPSFYVDDNDLTAAEVEDSWEEKPSIADPDVAEPTFEVSESIDSIIVDVEDQEPLAEEPATVETPAVEPVVTESMPPPVADVPPPISRPVMFGVGDPFSTSDLEAIVPEVLPQSAAMAPMKNAIDVVAEGNQLHLQLRGSGAIAEMGQVRALDIEVPVPGQWIGNQKVTLQFRLTLTPAEDENG